MFHNVNSISDVHSFCENLFRSQCSSPVMKARTHLKTRSYFFKSGMNSMCVQSVSYRHVAFREEKH